MVKGRQGRWRSTELAITAPTLSLSELKRGVAPGPLPAFYAKRGAHFAVHIVEIGHGTRLV